MSSVDTPCSDIRSCPIDTLHEYAQIQHDFNRNKYFNPQEALEYGLVDRVIKPPRTQALGVS